LVARRWSDEERSDDADSNEASAKMDQKDASEWVLIARREQDLSAIAEADQWEDLPPTIGQGVWTDDYSNVLGALLH
jgi:hypothetical protein